MESGYVAEADHKTMAKAIKDRVSLIRKKREQRQLVREEQEKRKLEAEQQKEAFKAPHTQVCGIRSVFIEVNSSWEEGSEEMLPCAPRVQIISN